ncbi:apolipoprotein N-acyltransferase [Zavarzinella formosa]|uniref:apolipoprotein N-acyltransferase n=1 Tax=Zavarzinella formosa TaxID=360055 RepID=UPI0003142020|nr:apolipoprotein N-acyltransferase [Zavarzinella formosa]
MNPVPRVWLPALLGGLLTYVCFFPLNLGFLAWVAFIPWFALVTAERPRSRGIYAACFFGSLLCHLGLIQWVRVAHPAMYASWAILALFCATGSCVSLFLARRLSRAGLPVWLAGAIAIVSVDYGKAHFPSGYPWLEWVGLWNPIGFGWYSLGHTQHEFLPLIQIADLTGVYGITFILVVVNGVLFASLGKSGAFRTVFRLSETTPGPGRLGIAVSLALVGGSLGYGFFRLNHNPFEEGPEIALIQGNLEQDVKNTHGDDMVRHFVNLCDQAAFVPKGTPKPQLVIWPETSFANAWVDVSEGVDPKNTTTSFQREYNLIRSDMRDFGRRWRTPMLYGLNRIEWEPSERLWKYNSAILFDERGSETGRYDKIHLVPFGEYVPMLETLPFMKTFTPYEGDYSCRPGQSFTKFELPTPARKYTFGCLICYEDSDPSLGRRYVTGPEPVDFLVNISNDGWFNGTEEHEQHLAIARFRAIEARRSLVRSVNMGISAIIDPDGRIVALPGETWRSSKKIPAILRGRIPVGYQSSPYATLGDWLPIGGWLFMLALAIRRVFRGRQSIVNSRAG